MKKLSLLLLTLGSALGLYAQTAPCCHTDAVTEFTGLANREDFRMAHKDPLPYTYQGTAGTEVSFPAPDGKTAYGFLFKARKPTDKYLFVFQEWYGLNDYVKKESEKLYNDLGGAVNVLAVDMYDKVVATNREEAAKTMQSVPRERLKAIMEAARNYAGKSASIVTLGWCFGGAIALQSALINGDRNMGCVMYYGMPEKDVNALKQLHGPVLGLFANKDKGITPQVVDEFEQNMKKAGKTLTVERYDAEHAFANPSNPIYNSDATKDAYTHTIAFLRERFK
ncbi:dienelactone hydrolase family protein [Chitinophaga varians]|uniref:dienelactone hydrolase family protein n=1 Tax=Chitinophaga varians TaxID=2202339 RepID=UPI00165F13E3|nr:dienelactone hydrolase family protein [Chitinophaga varians]MBC9914200.1 dienelactone hydrolase family protein [Chitinophaga varians]